MSTINNNGIITLMRGDSFVTPITVNIGTALSPEYHVLDEYDKLYFGLMEPNQAFEDAVLKKVFDCNSVKDEHGNVLLVLEPRDTERLLVGKYYYMIKWRRVDSSGSEYVKTIVNPTLFWLDGNNVNYEEEKYYEKGQYEIDKVIIDGGEITLPDNVQGVVVSG